MNNEAVPQQSEHLVLQTSGTGITSRSLAKVAVKKSRSANLTNALLHFNGWLALLIGAIFVLSPVSMLSPYGLQLELSSSLLSELRAPGGMLFVCGLVILHSAIVPFFRDRGLYLSVMLYGSYASVRLLSILVDGMPKLEVLIALVIEVTLCGLSLAALRIQQGARQ